MALPEPAVACGTPQLVRDGIAALKPMCEVDVDSEISLVCDESAVGGELTLMLQ